MRAVEARRDSSYEMPQRDWTLERKSYFDMMMTKEKKGGRCFVHLSRESIIFLAGSGLAAPLSHSVVHFLLQATILERCLFEQQISSSSWGTPSHSRMN